MVELKSVSKPKLSAITEDGIVIKSAFLHQATLLPGNKTEQTLNAIKIPGIKMKWIRGEGLLVNVKGEEAIIPDAAVKIAYIDNK